MNSSTMKSNAKTVRIALPLLIAMPTFMLFRGWPILEHEWLTMLLFFVFMTLYTPSFLKSKLFIMIIVYEGIVLLNYISTDGYFTQLSDVYLEFMRLFLPISATYYLLKRNDKKAMTYILIVFFALVVESAIASFIFDSSNPGIIRFIVGLTNGHRDITAYKPLFRLGLCDYILPHGLPILIPSLFLGISNKNIATRYRITIVIVLLCVLLLSYISGATTAVLLSVIVVITMLFVRRASIKRNVAVFTIISLISMPLLTNTNNIIKVLDLTQEVVAYGVYKNKILEIKNSIIYSEAEGDVGDRYDLYMYSIDALVNNFFLGTNENLGGHASLVDRFATLGVIGFIPLIVIFVFYIKMVLRYIKQYDRNIQFYYYVGCAVFLLLVSFKSMLQWEVCIVMFTIFPISIVILGQKQVNDYSKYIYPLKSTKNE